MLEARLHNLPVRPAPPQLAAGCVVRPAVAQDLAAVAVLWRQMMAEHVALHPAFALADDADERWHETMANLLGRHDSFVFLAEHAGAAKGSVAGFCSGWAARNPPIYATLQVGLISELAVAQNARRQRVGSALVARARAWFEARALHEFQLSTSVDNAAGRAFWRSVGGEELLVRYRFGL